MSRKNHLRIRAAHLDLDLKGEPEYVERAYLAIRPVLLERYRESLMVPTAIRETNENPAIAVTQKLPSVEEPEPRVVNLVLCNEVYNKIHVIERDGFEQSLLSRVLKFDGIRRIYINRSQETDFESNFTFGKVLWRELTSAGREAVKKGG